MTSAEPIIIKDEFFTSTQTQIIQNHLDTTNICVILDDNDLDFGYQVGKLRWEESRKQNLPDPTEGGPGTGGIPSIEKDTEAVRAEIAFARAFNLPANLGVNTMHDPDVAGIQVRSTFHLNGCLLFRTRSDSEKDLFSLLTGSGKEWLLIGYMKGEDIVNKYGEVKTWHNRPPVYAVHQRWLNKNWKELSRLVNENNKS